MVVETDTAAVARRQAWLRAGGGLSLIALLLAGLAFYEQQARTPAPPAVPAALAPLPAPNIVSTPSEPPIVPALAQPGEAGGSGEEAPVATPELSRAPEVAPPALRQPEEAPMPAGTGAAAEGHPRLTLHQAPSEPDAAEPAAAAAAPVAAPIPAGKGFLVQLGVFGSSANAESVYAELQRQGIPARIESRVVAGPFASRKSAEEARERLARVGLARGLVVPER